MQNLKVYSSTDLNSLVKTRTGETKFGEDVQLLTNYTNIYERLYDLDVDYVIFGVCEDIGVMANFGISGSYKAWDAAIKVLLNTQSNAYINATRVLILGHLDYSQQLKEVKNDNLTLNTKVELARKYTEIIDANVSNVVSQIVKAGKIPIIIGGGHNNAYGNIKGTAEAIGTTINAVILN